MNKEIVPAIYKNLCPNCFNDISSERLEKGLLCERCLPHLHISKDLCEDLKREGEFKKICDLWKDFKEFNTFFEKTINSSLWSIQKAWAIRFFTNTSFVLNAPTGIGKTTFGLILSKFLSEKGKKVYLIFPTQLLVEQAYKRLVDFRVKEEEILAYHAKFVSSRKRQREIKLRIENGNFKILISTTKFLYNNINIIPKGIWSLIFVDDVDSLLKSARNIDKLLLLLGFSEKDIEQTLFLISLKQKLLQKGKNLSDEKLKELKSWQDRIKSISLKKKGVLIVSSATSNPRSKRINLFKELLGFEVGRSHITLRNVEDIYEYCEEDNLWELSVNRIKLLGKQGLVFLPSSETLETLNKYVDFLNQRGIKAISYEKISDNIEKFKSKEVDVLVGFGSYRNPMARGLDLPESIRYALFVGVPKLKFTIKFEEDFFSLYYLLLILVPFLTKKGLISPILNKQLNSYINILKSTLFSDSEVKNLKKLEIIRNKVSSILEDPKIWKEIKNSPEISIRREDDKLVLVTADVAGYIQASGRTSRLYAGGLTKGLAYLLVEDKKAFFSLQKKIVWFGEDIKFKRIEDVNLNKILEEVDKDRENVKKVLEKKTISQTKDSFKTTVVVVESPNKARTISNFFGRPMRRRLNNLDVYEIITEDRLLIIVATKGHLFDLNKTEGHFGVLKKREDFVPIFEVIDEDKKEIVNSIRKLNLEAEEVYLATDPDTEGEKISYDLYLAIKPYNKFIKRAEFHEVTRRAFLKAISNSRDINKNLVKAQLIRRISDRWIGFHISHYVQKMLKNNHLSAGRVQTPVLEWIINRADEASHKVSIVRAEIGDDHSIEFEFENKKEAQSFLKELDEVVIEEKEKIKTYISIKPFTTDSMLSEATKKLKLSPQEVMNIAQELFEEGLITYHRTDSVRVSDTGILVAKEYILENFGEEYLSIKKFSHLQGAHECIRPTRSLDADELNSLKHSSFKFQSLTTRHIELYRLIFNRFIASQMKEPLIEKTTYKVKALSKAVEVQLTTSVLENGFNLVLPIKIKNLPIGISKVYHKKIFLKPKIEYYTFSSLIQDMKEKGIGRPSTYAITVQKLLERRYIVEKRGYLFPTSLGKKVLKLIKEEEKFYKFVSETFTKELENIMDNVEESKIEYQKELEKLFKEIFLHYRSFRTAFGFYESVRNFEHSHKIGKK